jgi:hypothetical protein
MAQEHALSAASRPGPGSATASDPDRTAGNAGLLLVVAWAAVAIPIAWGAWIALSKALAFFH